jgi:hypothetical protein
MPASSLSSGFQIESLTTFFNQFHMGDSDQVGMSSGAVYRTVELVRVQLKFLHLKISNSIQKSPLPGWYDD